MMDVSQPAKPRGLIIYPTNRDFMKKKPWQPAWPVTSWKHIITNVVMLIALLCGLAYFSFAVLYDVYRLRSQGDVVPGTLLEANQFGTMIQVEYEYAYNARRYSNKLDLYTTDWDGLIAQQNNLAVRLMPTDPQMSRVDGYGTTGERQAIFMAILGVPFTLILLVALIASINDRDQKGLLAKEGRMVRGEIVRYQMKKAPSRYAGVYGGSVAGAGCLGVAVAFVVIKLRDMFRRNKLKARYRTKIHYQFMSPKSGKLLRKAVDVVWEEGELPLEVAPGTQVAVYYRTDRHFRPL